MFIVKYRSADLIDSACDYEQKLLFLLSNADH